MVFAANTATVGFRTHFSTILTEFRRAMEATHASAPKIEKIHATAPVAAEVPAVVVPFLGLRQPNSNAKSPPACRKPKTLSRCG
jgi:hypothetical protein